MVADAPVSPAAESAVNAVRVASILEHVKQNNVSYLIGSLLAYQLGLLDQLVVWGAGCVA